jgi:1,4-dihydroxy-2-naphthoyl-CoA hydrolase
VDIVASIQEQLQHLFPNVLGMQLQEVTPERVVARLTVRSELCTVGEIMHGGAIMTFADTLGAVATIVNLPPGSRTTTIESKTNFLGAARLNTEVIAECTPLHRGKQTMVWQTKVQSAEGRLIAVVTQTQLVLQ